MIKFCRSCGKELSEPTDKTCPNCSFNPTKATAFCRYCSHTTSVEDVTCSHCGASIKPLPSSVRTLFEYPRLSTKMGKIINLSIVGVIVTAYIIFTLPKSVTKPVTQAASDVVVGNTGYTTIPLDHLDISPPRIPQTAIVMFDPQPSVVAVNTTRQITVYAIYKNSNSENATKAIRAVDVTDNCTYQSSNERIAVCSPTGLVLTTGSGTANITAFYTAAPGSANMSNAAAGKLPITVAASVGVFVR